MISPIPRMDAEDRAVVAARDRRRRNEERANAATHALAALFATAALVLLVVAAAATGDPWRIVTASVFGASLVLLYAVSTGYHLCRCEARKQRLRQMDHAAIYILIAGSYMPILLVLMRGPWGWSLTGVLWALAAYGVASKVRGIGRNELISTLIYLAMGWIGLVAIQPALTLLSPMLIGWIVAGGIAYTIGVIFFLWERLPFSHAVWHLFVAGGSACHVIGVMRHVIPPG